MPRLFLAVAADTLDGFEPWMRKLKVGADRKELHVRWVPEDLRHITVFFFGEVEDGRAEAVGDAVRGPLSEIDAFALRISGMDAFPDQRSGRVLWLGVQNSLKLRALRDRLAPPLAEAGFKVEERFTPHLTVGRLRNPKSVTDFLSPFAHVKLEKLPVRELALYESIQAGAFPVYKIRERFPLKAAAGTDD